MSSALPAVFSVMMGYVSDKLGSSVALMGLAAVAATGLALIFFVMPERRRTTQEDNAFR